MTKEELEKEAIKASDKKCVKGCSKYYRYGFQDGFITGAEPREKQIQALGERCLQLQKDKGNLTDKCNKLEEAKANLEYLLEGRDNEIDELKVQIKVLEQNLEDTEICENGWKNRVKELEAQNEKMKCCENCNNFMHRVDHRCNTKCKNLSEWEIKEK